MSPVTTFSPARLLPYSILGGLGVSVLGGSGRRRRGRPWLHGRLAAALPRRRRASVGPVGRGMAVVGPRLGSGGGGAQSGVQLGQGGVSPLAVLFKRLRLHHLAAVAAHHQVEVVMAGVEAKDGHVFQESRHTNQSHTQHSCIMKSQWKRTSVPKRPALRREGLLISLVMVRHKGGGGRVCWTSRGRFITQPDRAVKIAPFSANRYVSGPIGRDSPVPAPLAFPRPKQRDLRVSCG